MSSTPIIPRVLNRLFKAKEHRVVLMGVDYSGELCLGLRVGSISAELDRDL
jgi:hypothetical protein